MANNAAFRSCKIVIWPSFFCFVDFFRYIFIKPPQLGKNHTYETLSGTTYFVPTPENISCTGGTVTDISLPVTDENDRSFSYTLTIKDLRSCSGFEDITQEQADEIIQALAQLSALCYQALING